MAQEARERLDSEIAGGGAPEAVPKRRPELIHSSKAANEKVA